MRRLLFICMILVMVTLPITINGMLAQIPSKAGVTAVAVQDKRLGRSSPPDLTHYVREVTPEDYKVSRLPAASSAVFVRDVVVSNTDPKLASKDTFNDTE